MGVAGLRRPYRPRLHLGMAGRAWAARFLAARRGPRGRVRRRAGGRWGRRQGLVVEAVMDDGARPRPAGSGLAHQIGRHDDATRPDLADQAASSFWCPGTFQYGLYAGGSYMPDTRPRPQPRLIFPLHSVSSRCLAARGGERGVSRQLRAGGSDQEGTGAALRGAGRTQRRVRGRQAAGLAVGTMGPAWERCGPGAGPGAGRPRRPAPRGSRRQGGAN